MSDKCKERVKHYSFQIILLFLLSIKWATSQQKNEYTEKV